ncbi:MAG: ABC transporter substrate-binding protein [Gaiellales bacterium]
MLWGGVVATGWPQGSRGHLSLRLGAPVPLTGRYSVQGQQIEFTLSLWGESHDADVEMIDDQSDPQRSAEIHEDLRDRCDIVLGPYGSDSGRAVADLAAGATVWNHGAAADDVQMRTGVVSLPTPSSSYLVALARVIAEVQPGASVLVGRASGAFARAAVMGLERVSCALDLEVLGSHPLDRVESELRRARPDSILLCGPLHAEARLLARLERIAPDLLLGGVSPGLAEFAAVAGTQLDGALAPVQWHPDAVATVTLGPTVERFLVEADRWKGGQLDYVGVQAYAAALIAQESVIRRPDDPIRAARELRATTLYGDFGLDTGTGLQRDHSLAVIQRFRGDRRLVHTEGSS